MVEAMAEILGFVLKLEYRSSEQRELVDFSVHDTCEGINVSSAYFYVDQSQHKFEFDPSPTCSATDQLARSPRQERTFRLSRYNQV